MKLALGLNILLENLFEALRRRPLFNISCVSEREAKCIDVNILWGSTEYMPNNGNLFDVCCDLDILY
jgi:hypothetical protein